jgi:lysozyme
MPEILQIPNRPKQTREQSVSILKANHIEDHFALLGIRGYFKDTMGKPGQNERGIYDDAIFLITPTRYEAFNANVDPSVFRPGIATLKPGVWRYKIGIHGLSKPKAKQYKALVQAAPVTVVRDGGKEESGYLGINLHHGYNTETGSAGCQTIVPAQWETFIALVESEMKACGKAEIPYVLV